MRAGSLGNLMGSQTPVQTRMCALIPPKRRRAAEGGENLEESARQFTAVFTCLGGILLFWGGRDIVPNLSTQGRLLYAVGEPVPIHSLHSAGPLVHAALQVVLLHPLAMQW